MKLNYMNQNNRTDKRISLQKECILGDQFSWIDTQTIDVSKNGIGVKTDKTLPFKSGCELDVYIAGMARFPRAKLMWTKTDFNNTTRLGLKFFANILD